MKIVLMIGILFLISSYAMADVANYGYRVSVTKDVNGKYTNWVDIASADVTLELDEDTSLPKIYTDEERPDSSCLSTQNLQSWFISNEDDSGWYRLSFLATDAGLALPKGNKLLVYGFNYTKDTTVASPDYPVPGSMVIKTGGRPPVPDGS